MRADCGTTSIWMDQPIAPRPPLGGKLTTDVCVIGGGIAGITTAYLLAREGKQVVVLEAREVGSGETGRTTAHLSNAIDDRYFEIEKTFGQTGAKLTAASHSAAIDRIERICRDEHLDCELTRLDGYLLLGPGQSADILQDELAAAHRAGLEKVSFVDRAPLPGDSAVPSLRFTRQGRFHPLKYLAGLTAAAERMGVIVHEATRVVEVKDGVPVVVTCESGNTVTCNAVVVATDTPINDRVVTHLKQKAYRTYVVALEVPHGSVPDALFWDTQDPYHYLRLQEADDTHDLLIVGGEDHPTGQADDGEARWEQLESWTREMLPVAGARRYRWSGQVQETIDGLALIGLVPFAEHSYMITGDSGQGMTHTTLGAILITDLIMQRANPWQDLYDPGRLRTGSLGTLVGDTANMAAQYIDWVSPAEGHSAADVPPGEGVVIREGLHHYAVYRAADGTVTRCSAKCPHLGALVRWNSAEQSWDCPAHGSRFDPMGAPVCGPASTGLEADP